MSTRQRNRHHARLAIYAGLYAGFWLGILCIVSGCATQRDATGRALGAISAAGGHTEVIETAMERTKPRTDDVGRAYLDIGLASTVKVKESLSTSATEVELLGTALSEAQRDRDAAKAAYLKEHNHWLLKAYRFIRWVLIGLLAVHVLAGLAGLFIPGTLGAVLAKVGVAVNPFAWFQSLRDNAWFQRWSPAAKGEG